MSNALIQIKSIDGFEVSDFSYSPDREKKIAGFRFDDDKKRSALAEVLLKQTLAEFGVNTQLSYNYNEQGKPYLSSNEVFFNISHSGRYVAVAVSDVEIGIDIEEISPINLNIAKRFFAEDEYQRIFGSPKDLQNELFYDIWTKKEAYVKAKGLGMSLKFNSFSVESCDLNLFEIQELKGYKGAVCTLDRLNDIKIKLL